MTWEDPRPVADFFELIRQGDVEAVRRCIEEKTYDVNSSNHRRRSALSIAAEAGLDEIIVMFIANSEEVDFDSVDKDKRWNAAKWADVNGHRSTARLLEQAALFKACEKGDILTITMLLQEGLDVNFLFEGVSALHAAIFGGHIDTIRTLLAHGVRPDLVALGFAVLLEHEEIVDILVKEKGFQVVPGDKDWSRLLKMIIEVGDLSIVEWFLKAGATLESYSSEEGDTPLHIAAKDGQLKITIFLLSQGLDPNIQDAQGVSALHLAAAGGNKEVLERLLEGADATQEDISGRSILHFASISESIETLDLAIATTISTELSLDQADHDGWTALHWAARKGDKGIVNALLEAGVTISTETIYDWTPDDVADSHDQFGALSALLQAQDKQLKYTIEELVERGIAREARVSPICMGCGLPCTFGSHHKCITCKIFTLCFKCGRRCDVVHPGHQFEVVQG